MVRVPSTRSPPAAAASPGRHRRACCSRASTTTTRCSAIARAPRSAISRRATGSRSSMSRAIASTSTTAACRRPPSSIERDFRSAGLDGAGGEALWEEVKRHFIGLLIDHRQPECAETFFNSVSCKIAAPRRTSTTASSSCGPRSRPSTSTPTRRRTAATTRASRACATR